MAGDVFQRVEKKYRLTSAQYEAFCAHMAPYMEEDVYGLHTISNIYYDTKQYDLIRTSIEKPRYKEKLRLRGYRTPGLDSMVFLEIKKKYAGMVYKRRVSMTLQEAYDYLDNKKRPSIRGQIMNEIDYFISYYQPVPKLYLAYDRVAYFGKEDPELRITIDRNIRSRETQLRLEKGDAGELLLDADQYLVEIKVPTAMPLWMVRSLSELRIYPVSFSKYGSVYQQHFAENGIGYLGIDMETAPNNKKEEENYQCLQAY